MPRIVSRHLAAAQMQNNEKSSKLHLESQNCFHRQSNRIMASRGLLNIVGSILFMIRFSQPSSQPTERRSEQMTVDDVSWRKIHFEDSLASWLSSVSSAEHRDPTDANDTTPAIERRDSCKPLQSPCCPDDVPISEKHSFSNVPEPPLSNHTLGDSLMAQHSSKLKSQQRQRVAFAEPTNQAINCRNSSYSGKFGIGCADQSRPALDVHNISAWHNQSNPRKATKVSLLVVNPHLEDSACKWIAYASTFSLYLLCVVLLGYYLWLSQS